MGSLALASLLNPSLLNAAETVKAAATQEAKWLGAINPLHFAPKAKRVIYLYMAGGPSHLETLDYKPTLARMAGKGMPESITKGQPIAQLQGNKELKCLEPQFEFKKFGKSGQEICSQFPHIGSIADDICIIRSMKTEAINHDPAHTFMNTGTSISGRPSMGSWLWYGLGSESQDLPGFVVLTSTGASGQQQPIATRQWHSGFLPSKFQGVHFHSKGDPVYHLGNPAGVSRDQQRDVIDTIQSLNRIEQESIDDPEIATRISQYEMAFKMQASVPGLMDISSEPKEVLESYGTTGSDGTFAANCLLARRLAERGVRFIQCYHRDWDHHSGMREGLPIIAKEVDQPAAALIKDLKARGMLDETLVVWGGEFGRTPMVETNPALGRSLGRDHHPQAFTMWMAGGGVKPGITWGATDDFGFHVTENPVHVHDLQATLLHCLGFDHERLTFHHAGRDFRLTDVHGHVVKDLLS
jgi:hypothetical protein